MIRKHLCLLKIYFNFWQSQRVFSFDILMKIIWMIFKQEAKLHLFLIVKYIIYSWILPILLHNIRMTQMLQYSNFSQGGYRKSFIFLTHLYFLDCHLFPCFFINSWSNHTKWSLSNFWKKLKPFSKLSIKLGWRVNKSLLFKYICRKCVHLNIISLI